MVGYHCGRRVVPRSNNRHFFSVRCVVCGKQFRQRKRKPNWELTPGGELGPVKGESHGGTA